MLEETKEALNTLGAASTGSIISMVFRWDKGAVLKGIFRGICGVAVSYYASPIALELLHWPATSAYEKFVYAILGITGYSILELLMNPEIWTAAKEAAAKRIGKAAE